MRNSKLFKTAMLAMAMGCLMVITDSCSTAREVQSGKKTAYTVANHYFVRNDISGYGTMTINTQADFDKVFGAAAVMGEGGLPTAIDFSRQTVLAVTMPPSRSEVALSPVSLTSDGNGTVTFSYKATMTAQHRSYSSTASLIVITNKLNDGSVKFQQVH